MDNIIREALLNENSTLTPDSIAYLTEAITDRIAYDSGDTIEYFLSLNFFTAGGARRVTRAVNEARIAHLISSLPTKLTTAPTTKPHVSKPALD